MKHITNGYLLSPNNPVTVSVIGVGGTGSYLLTKLALLNNALKAIGHIGLEVDVYDPDVVSSANLSRQLFFESDLGRNKAEVLVERINWNFNYDWKSFGEDYQIKHHPCNITISCVDSVKSRKDILSVLTKNKNKHPRDKAYYWIDCGNSFRIGQVILGTIKERKNKLPTFFDQFSNKSFKDTEDQPSCSMAESLNRQDLFVNSFVADIAANMLWTMFRYGGIDYRGVFFNLETMQMNPILI